MLTIREIREICGSDPKNLPVLWVHDLASWTGDAKVDSEGRLHMNGAQLAKIRCSLPIRKVGRVGPTTVEYAIDLKAHHLVGGLRDKTRPAETAKKRQNVKRRLTGADQW